MPEFSKTVRERVTQMVTAENAPSLVADYFRPGSPPEDLAWTGGWFERLDGGGDRDEVANRFSAADLVAVTMLSVEIPARVAVDLLHGQVGRDLSGLLEQIPTSARLEAASPADVDDDSPAARAWAVLEEQHGLGWVTAGKLMARKRPHLVPVYDEVVRCVLGKPDGQVWERYREALQVRDGELAGQLDKLRAAAGLGDEVSLLRVLDVVLWRGHAADHRARRCDHGAA